MERLIDFYANRTVAVDQGYRFMKKETVYIPIIQTYLSVTKRDYYALPVLEEMVLRLIAEDVNEISTMAEILGINRNILEVTIADLCVNDMIYSSADRCNLYAKGRSALNDLKVKKRSKESLRNIYYDPINKRVLEDYEQFDYISKLYDDDRKLSADYDRNDIRVYRNNFYIISKIFEDEVESYIDYTKMSKSELISIDEIENVYSKFIKLDFAIYVSEDGYDIDLVALDKSKNSFFLEYKEKIISDIRDRKILKNIFTKYPIRKNYTGYNYSEDKVLITLSRDYYKEKKGTDEKEAIKKDIESRILANRALYDMEINNLLSYLCKLSDEITINVDCLDDWCYGNDFFVSALSEIGTKKLKGIRYSYTRDLDKCRANICRTVKVPKHLLEQSDNNSYFSLIFDEKWEISINPEDVKILDESTHIYYYRFMLKCN